MYIIATKEACPTTHQVSIAEARADLSAYINRVAHGNQRIVLTSRGRPKAALVSLEDLHALEALNDKTAVIEDDLADVDAFVEQLRRSRKGVVMPDSGEAIHQMRKERMRELLAPGEDI